MQSGWGSMKSPSKEKTEKDAELKPDVPPKDTVVSETAPQIPEPTTAEPATEAAAAPTTEITEPKSESKPAEAAKEQLDAVSPKEKSGFLSNLLNKRNRSVSPSANMKEAPVKKEETPAAPIKDEVAEPSTAAATEEPSKPVTETPVATETLDKPAEKFEEPAKTDATSPTTNKRQSVIGNLGRRASKAFKGFQAPAKKETATPTSIEAKKAEETVPEAESKPTVNGETKAPEAEHQPSSIGDVTPDSVNIGQAQTTPTVTASA